MTIQKEYTFEISLSVLNHLGRNLYRSFATVLGEAISNAWDADANNVWIYLNKEKNSFFIKDDGIGMTENNFQNKFLKIGYSKRKEGDHSPSGRPYIGRKGIGKLALLSCAQRISVATKVENMDYTGGVIDNSSLDSAITDDLTPQQYKLNAINMKDFELLNKNHTRGTIIYFENIKEGIKHSLEFLKKIIALYFRFSLLDTKFNIYIDNQLVGLDSLDDLATNTEFLWRINIIDDPYIKMLQAKFTSENNEEDVIKLDSDIKGFIASVELPRHLKIITIDEKLGVDLFVNGRLRERDILRHIPTARVVESYLYGQIHYNSLDDSIDRFTSSREGIVADDQKFVEFLMILKEKIINKILEDWDVWRRKHRKSGDSENPKLTPKQRKAEELYNAVSDEYSLPKGSKNKKKVDKWVDELSVDAAHNFVSYADCFISENLIRKYIEQEEISLSKEAKRDIREFRKKESRNKRAGGVSIDLRKSNSTLSYLAMDGLAHLADKDRDENSLHKDSKSYKPIRDALMHTALLTEAAKTKLRSVYDNMCARIKNLLSGDEDNDDDTKST